MIQSSICSRNGKFAVFLAVSACAIFACTLTGCGSIPSAGGSAPVGGGLVSFPTGGGVDVLNARTGYKLLHVPAKDPSPDVTDYFTWSEGPTRLRIDSARKKLVDFKNKLEEFHEGLASARTTMSGFMYDGNCGYVDESYKFVIAAAYLFCGDFSEGLAMVHGKDGARYIDKSGKTVIAGSFAAAGKFSEGLAAVKNQDNRWGYIDHSGKVVLPYKYSSDGEFHDGWASQGSFYIDKTGKTIDISGGYCGPFSEGLAIAGGKLIDKSGTTIPSPNFNDLLVPGANISTFRDGLVRLAAGSDGVVLMNRNGKFVTDAKRVISYLAPGYWYIWNKDGTTGVLDKDLKPLKVPSPYCKTLGDEYSVLGKPNNLYGVLQCPVADPTSGEQRVATKDGKSGKLWVIFSIYGWQSVEFVY